MADAKQCILTGPHYSSSTTGFASQALSASNTSVAVVFQAVAAMTITRLGYRLNSITGSSPVYRISLQGVDSSGLPDGTILGGGSPASATFTPSGSGFKWVTLDNTLAITRGTRYALVIDYSSGTVNASNCANVSYVTQTPTLRFPYALTNVAGGGWTKNNFGVPVFGYGPSGTAYGKPFDTFSGATYSDSSNPDEYALKFTVPADWCDTYKVVGIQFYGGVAAAGSMLIQLYSGTDTTAANSTGAVSETTVQQTITWDTDYQSSTGSGVTEWFFEDATLATLYAGATYRIGIKSTSATNVTNAYHGVASTSDWAAFRAGSDRSYSTRNNGSGNWTDTDTRQLHIDLILDDITEPAASGGSSINVRRRKHRQGSSINKRRKIAIPQGSVSITNNTNIFRRTRQVVYQQDQIVRPRVFLQNTITGGSGTVMVHRRRRATHVKQAVIYRVRPQLPSITNTNVYVPIQRHKNIVRATAAIVRKRKVQIGGGGGSTTVYVPLSKRRSGKIISRTWISRTRPVIALTQNVSTSLVVHRRRSVR